jgi:DHA2 family multidrug resistance protein
MCVGMFMAILDIQIVAASLPAIQGALAIRTDEMSWLQTSYLIAEIIAIPLTGVLTRVLTLRGLFAATTSLFILASAACAASTGFSSLVAWRVAQGFCGGMLIPLVFSAAFVLFPASGQRLAAAIAGMLAVLAPTVGPFVGGWITTNWSWHWIFLVNLAPGIAAVAVGMLCLPRDTLRLSDLRSLDIVSIALIALALAALEIGLKQAPHDGWLAWYSAGLLALALGLGAMFALRTLLASHPVVQLRELADRNLALGCALSFVLGLGLYGNVYLMPVFLAYVGGHDAQEIGEIMLVTGATQFISAPIVVWLETRISARTLTVLGFVGFAAGLAMSAFDNPRADFDEMLLPQIVRGISIMFCLLPPTRIALGDLPAHRVPDASALFNLMRNLGGAIGLALIDTILFGRSERHGLALANRLLNFDAAAYAFVGLPRPALGTEITEQMKEMARPAVERAALTLSVNEAWAMLAMLTALGVLVALAVRKTDTTTRAAEEL